MNHAGDLSLSNDAAQVIAINRWQQDDLAKAYRRHAGAVYALARRLLNDATLAEEVVQEVFLRTWEAPEKFDPERGSLRSYLLAQCHGRSVDLIRAEQSRRNRELKDHRQQADTGYDLEHEVWDLTMAEHVWDAVAGLPSEQRRAIELAYLGGHTYREVAVLLDQPEGTVKSRIRAGIRGMRHGLAAGVGAQR